MMELKKIMEILTESGARRIDGPFKIDNKNYQFKAYIISNPEKLIRIDIKEVKNDSTEESKT